MNEKLLQYIWNFKIFHNTDFKDTDGNPLEIISFGHWNQDSGPDFTMAKIRKNGILFVGNIEIHLKTSDWIFHKHQQNEEYKNIILHVVFHNDAVISEQQIRNIPTLELKNYISPIILGKYKTLQNETSFIPCEKIWDNKKIPLQFAEEQLLKKLDQKSIEIEQSLERFQNNYEAVFFHQISYSFGLKINAPIFKLLAENIDYSIIQKIKHHLPYLEALFFGKAKLLEQPQDEYTKNWKREFDFIKNKYKLPEVYFAPKFLRLRPPNFPTIRLSQLANLYHTFPALFSLLMEAKNTQEMRSIFSKVQASEYWDNHYNFGKFSEQNIIKKLTNSFIDIILINAVLPMKYTYTKNLREDSVEEILEFYQNIPSEENTIIRNWKNLGLHPKSAIDSQAYIYQYQYQCTPKKCLNCSIGFQLLKN